MMERVMNPLEPEEGSFSFHKMNHPLLILFNPFFFSLSTVASCIRHY